MKPHVVQVLARPVERAGLHPMPDRPAVKALAGILSVNTKLAYERDIKDFFKVDDLALIDPKRVFSVTPDEVTEFRDKLISLKLKPSTVNRKLTALRTMYSYLMERKVIDVNPANSKLVRSPKKSNIKHTRWLPNEECDAILSAPDRSVELGIRDYAMLYLAMSAGLRRSEVCLFKDENVGRWGDRPAVMMRGKGEKERRIPISDEVYAAIEEWRSVRPPGAEWLFVSERGTRMSENNFWKVVQRHAVAAGLKKGSVKPHSFRATYIKTLDDAGVPISQIQELVGHSRGDTTLGYIRELDTMRSKAPEKMLAALGEAARAARAHAASGAPGRSQEPDPASGGSSGR